MNNLLTMKQACKATGMSYEALKFYCNEGLVPNVKRAENNYRVFDEHDVNWIRSLQENSKPVEDYTGEEDEKSILYELNHNIRKLFMRSLLSGIIAAVVVLSLIHI